MKANNMHMCTQEKICTHFHATNLSTSIAIACLIFSQEEVCYFLNISVVMRIEVYVLRDVCTSPSPHANEPVNRLTPERSGSPN